LPESQLRPLLLGIRQEDALFDFGALHTQAFRSEKLRILGDNLWTAAADELPISRLAVDGALLCLLAEIYEIAERPSLNIRGGLAPWQLRWVNEHMEAHLGEEVTLSTLAALVGLSPNHFCTAFKVSTGEPPHRYFVRLRIERSKQFLREQRKTVTDVALELGFASSAHFSTVFRKHVGVTPTEFRRDVLERSPRRLL
jgi:AraC family transcriptional regulator